MVQPSLSFVSKARVYPSGANLRRYPLEKAPVFTCKCYTRLERLACDKRFSLFGVVEKKRFFLALKPVYNLSREETITVEIKQKQVKILNNFSKLFFIRFYFSFLYSLRSGKIRQRCWLDVFIIIPLIRNVLKSFSGSDGNQLLDGDKKNTNNSR